MKYVKKETKRQQKIREKKKTFLHVDMAKRAGRVGFKSGQSDRWSKWVMG